MPGTATDPHVESLRSAAATLLDLHEGEQDTSEEWDALHRAVLAVEEAAVPPAAVRVEEETLVRRSRGHGGEEHVVRCQPGDVEQVACAIEEARGGWFVVAEVATRSARPWLVALMAVEFLAGCGLVRGEGVGHRLRAAEGFSPEAALAELAVAQIRAKEA